MQITEYYSTVKKNEIGTENMVYQVRALPVQA